MPYLEGHKNIITLTVEEQTFTFNDKWKPHNITSTIEHAMTSEIPMI